MPCYVLTLNLIAITPSRGRTELRGWPSRRRARVVTFNLIAGLRSTTRLTLVSITLAASSRRLRPIHASSNVVANGANVERSRTVS